jgi:TfoX/Sxy family transcriptional regulator of competence genes
MDRVKTDSLLLRFQTALICESLIGKGNGARFVMDSWQLEETQELTKDDIKKLLKEKKEKDALRRLKKQQNG